MDTIEVIEDNGEVKEVQIDSNKQNDPQITFNEVEFPDDEKVKKLAKKQKRNEIISTIILLIIIGGIAFGILYYTGVIKFGDNNQNNQNQNGSIILSGEDKKQILNMIGLTENGYERLGIDDIQALNLTGTDYIDFSSFNKATYFIEMSAGSHTVNDFEKYDFENFFSIAIDANEEQLKTFKSDGSASHPCKSATGYCSGISEELYEEFAKKYNINEVGKAKLVKYNGYYLVSSFGTLLNPAKITDSVSFSSDKENILVTYQIEKTPIDIVQEENNPSINKTIVFNFKKYEDGSFYLYTFDITNNK